MRRPSLKNKKPINIIIKNLDAFPKVPESYVAKSAFGGTGELSLLEHYIVYYLYYNKRRS